MDWTGPVIFLDVDGVLDSARCLTCDFERDDRTLFLPRSAAFSTPLERRALSCLQRLVRASGARIVVSSSWRGVAEAMEHLRAALAEYDLEVLDTTSGSSSRGEEIEAWLARHPVAGFVILEDSDRHVASFAARPALAQRYVQTYLHETAPPSPREEGLTDAHVAAALGILGVAD